MRNLIVEFLLPRTDAGVAAQWAVLTPVWALVIWKTWNIQHDVRLLVWGVLSINVAWFLIRMAH